MKKACKLIEDCKATNYKGKFGLGCVQWTGSRTKNLIDCYVDECGEEGYPTREQYYKAESTLISKEFNGNYKKIYEEWLSKHSGKNTAAYEAGSMVCLKYEVPADRYNKAKTRGKSAQKIYQAMMGA
ncbi:hypothetical protein SAMN02744040_02326 [Tepidibacter thalassicus DSM 15285]|uniref:Phage tail lysozyme domain-containing protein n=2 Tax=Tepidibacter TaxID=214904 RepID=A0A1M5TXV3_9FIRM|nr:hypothetical protein SAMN02744040_02326 [Tepidibacter thalassicus DSM 15285]